MSDLLGLNEIIRQVRVQLFDESKRFWGDAEIIDAINDGRRALFSMKPRVYETTAAVSLVAGHRQKVPDDSTMFFRAIDNVTASSKRGITAIDLELLTRVRPRWRTEGVSNEIVHVMYVETAPTDFEVYPPAKAGTQIRISYSKRPVELTLADRDAASDVLLAGEREQAGGLIDYAIHRCLLKEADSTPAMAARAMQYMQIAVAKFTGESSGKAKSTPNVTAVGGAAPRVQQ